MKDNLRKATAAFVQKKHSLLIMFFLMLVSLTMMCKPVYAASYNADYRYWSQGSSDYIGMREVGCLITAQAKMLYEANVNRSASFNPDAWYLWLLNTGGIASSSNLYMKNHNSPAVYAASIGKNLEYLGNWKASSDQLWFNIRAGYYTIVNVSNHYVLIDNATSLRTGQLYIYDSFTGSAGNSYRTDYNPGPRLLSNYATWVSGHVYKSNNNTHTHSYSSSVTRKPTCTATGVRTYTCSCGNSYTESVAALGHSYTSKVVAPTETAKGYTLHTCSRCGNSYKDNYVDMVKPDSSGWYYSTSLPAGVSTANYEIQYNNYYEKVQGSSPGTGWTNAGVVKNEWVNSGGIYTSERDLSTSNARVLVRSVYYHFCGPNAGNEGNYEISGKFVHYDEVPATSVTATYCGVDNGHPYYVLSWVDSGARVWCQSGVTCDGTYGSHGARCKAWYKQNTYQDRVNVVKYKFKKSSGWINTKDSSATSVQYRYKSLSSGSGKKSFSLKLGKTSYTCNYKAQKPKITVNVKGKTVASKYYTVSYKNNKNPGIATVTVNGKGEYAGYSGTASFKISPKKSSLSAVKSTAKKKAAVTWSKMSGITGYQIQYSNSKTFKSGNKTKNVTGASKKSYTLAGLTSKKTYYVRIRAYKKSGNTMIYGSWSAVKKVKVK